MNLLHVCGPPSALGFCVCVQLCAYSVVLCAAKVSDLYKFDDPKLICLPCNTNKEVYMRVSSNKEGCGDNMFQEDDQTIKAEMYHTDVAGAAHGARGHRTHVPSL